MASERNTPSFKLPGARAIYKEEVIERQHPSNRCPGGRAVGSLACSRALAESVLQTLRRFQQLFFQALDLLRNIFELLFRHHAGLRNLASRSLGSSHHGSHSGRRAADPVFFSHLCPLLESVCISPSVMRASIPP